MGDKKKTLVRFDGEELGVNNFKYDATALVFIGNGAFLIFLGDTSRWRVPTEV